MIILIAVAVAAAILLVSDAPGGLRRRLHRGGRAGPPGGRPAPRGPGDESAGRRPLNRQDVADLTGRLAAISRAGVPGHRAWQVLGHGRGAGADVAARVSRMIAVGGSVTDGLQSAVALTGPRSPGAEALGWLAITHEILDTAGAPAAALHDGIAAGLVAELARADDQAAALAGPRTTAAVLAALPLAGAGLGATLGANVPGTLLGTDPGRICAVTGLLLWWAGWRWIRLLVTRAAAAGQAGHGPFPGSPRRPS